VQGVTQEQPAASSYTNTAIMR